jgi:APA family basic amino acid/polyamine antiporter
MTELKKQLGITEVVFFGVGSILGAGIYVLIGRVAGFAGNMLWLAFLIASLAAFFTAYSYAELSAMFPGSAGEYIYVKEAIGDRTAAIFGIILSLSGLISGAAVALGFAGYLSQLVNWPYWISAPAILLFIYLVNVSGVKNSAALNVVFTIIELGGLALVIYASLPFVGSVDYLELPDDGVRGLLTGSALSFYAYLGFERIIKLIEETKQGEKQVPRAIFISNFLVVIIYTLVAICVVSVIPWEKLKDSDSPLTDLIEQRYGKWGMLTITIIALFSTSNTILANMLASSRVILGMGREIRLLKRFSALSEKRRTPVAALTLLLIAMCLFSLIGEIETVARLTNFLIFFVFIMVNVTVIILRFTRGEQARPFQIKGRIGKVPLIPLFGILITLLLLIYNIYGLT